MGSWRKLATLCPRYLRALTAAGVALGLADSSPNNTSPMNSGILLLQVQRLKCSL
jgi:hypothetical protein